MSALKPLSKRYGIIRWRGLIPLAILAVAFVLYTLLFFDLHFKDIIETWGSRLNSAQVNVESVRTKLTKGEIEIKGVQITDLSEPMKNLVEIDRVKIRFQWGPVLRRKFIVKEMAITGLKYGTKRASSGLLSLDDSRNTTGLIERVASGVYSDLRTEIGDNPFRNIGQLLTGLNITGRVEASLKELESKQMAETLVDKLTKSAPEWKSRLASLPSSDPIVSERALAKASKEELEGLKQRLADSKEALAKVATPLSDDLMKAAKEVSAVNLAVDKDVNRLRDRLKLPKLDHPDMTPGMLGPALITYLERITYWVDLARRKMPKGSRQGQLALVAQQDGPGLTVNFGKMSAYPAFLLYEATISSDASNGKNSGTVTGKLTGLTSDPPIFGRPTQFELKADFPDSGINGFRLNATIDHTGQEAVEEVKVGVQSFPMKGFAVSETGDVKLLISNAVASFDASIAFHEGQLNGSLDATFREAQYSVNSRFKRIEYAIKDIVQPITSFTLRGDVNGSLDALKFKLESPLGRTIASGIQSEFKHQILAVEDDLRKNILDQVHPVIEQAENKIKDVRNTALVPTETRLRAVQELLAQSDKQLVRSGSGGRRAASRRITSQPRK